jgi:phage-related protein
VASFPLLKTGAIAQYPSDRTQQTFTSVFRFVDGSEQRFRTGSTPLKKWLIRLDLLDESELTALEEFFSSQAGRFGSFAFTDPWDNTVHSDCSLDSDQLELNFRDWSRGAVQVMVKENR